MSLSKTSIIILKFNSNKGLFDSCWRTVHGVCVQGLSCEYLSAHILQGLYSVIRIFMGKGRYSVYLCLKELYCLCIFVRSKIVSCTIVRSRTVPNIFMRRGIVLGIFVSKRNVLGTFVRTWIVLSIFLHSRTVLCIIVRTWIILQGRFSVF